MRENNSNLKQNKFDLGKNVYYQFLQEILKVTFTHDVQMNYFQKNNWAHLLDC